MSNRCDLLSIIMFIFTIINQVISIKPTQLFFVFFCLIYFLPVKRSVLGCCLAFAYVFANFSVVVLINALLLCVAFACIHFYSEAYSKSYQVSKMELLMKIVNRFQLLTIFAKSSILYVWLGFEYASVISVLFSNLQEAEGNEI